MNEAQARLEEAFHNDWAVILSGLARHVGITLAEEATADAFAQAAERWPRDGVPRRPGAWLTVAAQRRAIDRVRRERSQADRAAALAELQGTDVATEPPTDDRPIADERLRLVFTCCHPALSREARVALTLRVVGGLATPEIARAFLVSEATMGQRIVRAKRKIAVANIPYAVPAEHEMPDRLASVLEVLYLVFNEGYESTAGEELDRPDLAVEAIRLTKMLCVLMPDEPEAFGLLALMLLTHARRAARTDTAGRFVALGSQDRRLWSRPHLEEGTRSLERAMRMGRAGPFQLEAAIAAVHSEASDESDTNWPFIVQLYERLGQLAPSSVVNLNRAVALALGGDVPAGRAALERVRPELSGYVPFHAADADLHRRAGNVDAAAAAFDLAIAASDNGPQRAELQRRRDALA